MENFILIAPGAAKNWRKWESIIMSKNSFVIVEVNNTFKARRGWTKRISDIINLEEHECYPGELWECEIVSREDNKVKLLDKVVRYYERRDKFKKLYMKKKEKQQL